MPWIEQNGKWVWNAYEENDLRQTGLHGGRAIAQNTGQMQGPPVPGTDSYNQGVSSYDATHGTPQDDNWSNFGDIQKQYNQSQGVDTGQMFGPPIPGSDTYNQGVSDAQGTPLPQDNGGWLGKLRNFFGIQTPDQKINDQLSAIQGIEQNGLGPNAAISQYTPSFSDYVQQAPDAAKEFVQNIGQGAADMSGLNAAAAAIWNKSGGSPTTSNDWNAVSPEQQQNPNYISPFAAEVGRGVGGALPFMLAGPLGEADVAGKVGLDSSGIFGRAANQAFNMGMQGAAVGAVQQAAQGASDPNNFSMGNALTEVGKNAGNMAMLGAVGGTAGHAVRDVLGRIIPNAVPEAIGNVGTNILGGAAVGAGAATAKAGYNLATDPNYTMQQAGHDIAHDAALFGSMDAMMGAFHGGNMGKFQQGSAQSSSGTDSPRPEGFKYAQPENKFVNNANEFVTGTHDLTGYVEETTRSGAGTGRWYPNGDKMQSPLVEYVPTGDGWVVPKWEVARNDRKAGRAPTQTPEQTTANPQNNPQVQIGEPLALPFDAKGDLTEQPQVQPVPQDQVQQVEQFAKEAGVDPSQLAGQQSPNEQKSAQAPHEEKNSQRTIDNIQPGDKINFHAYLADAKPNHQEFTGTATGENTNDHFGVQADGFPYNSIHRNNILNVEKTETPPNAPHSEVKAPNAAEVPTNATDATAPVQSDVHDVWNRVTGGKRGELEINPDKSLNYNVSKNMAKIPHGQISSEDNKMLRDTIKNHIEGRGAAEVPVEQPKAEAPNEPASAPRLSQDLSGAKPRYSYGEKQFHLDFHSDVDRALYVVSGKGESKSHAKYAKWLHENTDIPHNEYQSRGSTIRDTIKGMARDANPDETPTLKVPDHGKTEVPEASTPPQKIEKPESTLKPGRKDAEWPREVKYGDRVSFKTHRGSVYKDLTIHDTIGEDGSYHTAGTFVEKGKRLPWITISGAMKSEPNELLKHEPMDEKTINTKYQKGDRIVVGGKPYGVSIQIGDEVVANKLSGSYPGVVFHVNQIEKKDGRLTRPEDVKVGNKVRYLTESGEKQGEIIALQHEKYGNPDTPFHNVFIKRTQANGKEVTDHIHVKGIQEIMADQGGKQAETPQETKPQAEEKSAKKKVTQLGPEEMTDREYMSQYNHKELQATAGLLGAPYTGTKEKIIGRIATFAELRQKLAGETRESLLGKYNVKQMKDLLRNVNESLSPSDKKSLAGKLITWRDKTKVSGQKLLEDVRAKRANLDMLPEQKPQQEIERDYMDVGEHTFETGQVVSVLKNGKYNVERIGKFNHEHDEIGTEYPGSVTGGVNFKPSKDIMPIDEAIKQGKVTAGDVERAVEKAGWEMPEGISVEGDQQKSEAPTIDYNRKNLPTKQQSAIDKLLKEDRDWKGIWQDKKLNIGWVELRYTDERGDQSIIVDPKGEVFPDAGYTQVPSQMRELWRPAENDYSFAGMGLTVKERTKARHIAETRKSLGVPIDAEAIAKSVREHFDNALVDNAKEREAMKPKVDPVQETQNDLNDLNAQIASYEKGLHDQMSGEVKDASGASNLVKEIKDRGGIKPSERFAEEYKKIPLHLKNKNGMPIDEIADELGTTANELINRLTNDKKVADVSQHVQEMLDKDETHKSLLATRDALEEGLKGIQEQQEEPASHSGTDELAIGDTEKMTDGEIKKAIVQHMFDNIPGLKEAVDSVSDKFRPKKLQVLRDKVGDYSAEGNGVKFSAYRGHRGQKGDYVIDPTMSFKRDGVQGDVRLTFNDALKMYEGKYNAQEGDDRVPEKAKYPVSPEYSKAIEHWVSDYEQGRSTDQPLRIVQRKKGSEFVEYRNAGGQVHYRFFTGMVGRWFEGDSSFYHADSEHLPVQTVYKFPQIAQKTSASSTKPVADEKAPRTMRPLPENAADLKPGEFETYTKAMRSLIGKFHDELKNDTLPNKKESIRKMASEHIGRVATEDEWSDALEAAVQQYANDKITPNMSLEERIKAGQEAEKHLLTGNRSIEKSERQQFSTPIPIAQAVHYAADVQKGETVKEGSAGTGSLLFPFKGDGVDLKAVELSPRRAAILKAQGFDVTNSDTFKVNVKSDVAVGNPPFRGQNVGKGTVEFAGNAPWKGGWGDLGNRFMNWDLKSIPDGGRVVHVTSPGVIDNKQNAEFRKWLRENNTVRAMIKLPADVYDTRGTKFGAGLIVVDKGKVEGAVEPIIGEATDWNHAIEMLKPLGEGGTHARVVENKPDNVQERTAGDRSDVEGAAVREPAPAERRVGETAGEGGPENRRGQSGDSRSAESGTSGPTLVRDANGTDDGRSVLDESGNKPADVVAGKPGDVRSEVPPTSEAPVGNDGSGVSKRTAKATSASSDPNLQKHMGYVPGRELTGRAHRGSVVEAQNLTFVEYPQGMYGDKYIPHDRVVKGGPNATKQLSDIQLESVMAAKYNHAQDMRGVLIADDTGMGKTAEQLGIIADAWHTGRAKRILVVTTKDQVAQSSFMGENDEFDFGIPMEFANTQTHANQRDALLEGEHKADWKPFEHGDGVLLVSKDSFVNLNKAIHGWLDGSDKINVMVDESHDFKNVHGSKRGESMKELYEKFGDKAQFIYSSATAAHELEGLEHLYGLKLWTPNSFGDFRMRLQGFESNTSSGGKGDKKNKLARGLSKGGNSPFKQEIPLSMMEQIVRELKSNGQYVGRQLGMHGVDLNAIPINLTPEDKGDWNRAVEFVKLVAQKAEAHGNKATDRGKIMSHVVGYMRRLRSYYVMKGIIKHIEQYQGDSKGLKRFVLSGEFKGGDEGQNAHMYAAVNAINDKTTMEDTRTGETNSVEIPEAIYDKNELRSILMGENPEWGDKPLPDLPSPIDLLNKAFGDDKVLVISGDIPAKERPAVVRAFQKGEMPIIYFTTAGNTGINLHDTIGDRIGFYHVDYSWTPDSAKQSEGRVNRTGQLTAPVIHYPYTDSALDMKFVGTLLARYEAMGALSRGESAKLGGDALGDFDFGSPIAEDAVFSLIPKLDPEDRAAMFGEFTRDRFPEEAAELGWDKDTVREQLSQKELDVKKFLNSLMYLDFDRGNEVFSQYTDEIDAIKDKLGEAAGVVDKFNTYYGDQTSVSEGAQGIKLRKIQTQLTDRQKTQYDAQINRLTERRDMAQEKHNAALEIAVEQAQEKLEKAKDEKEDAERELVAVQRERSALSSEWDELQSTPMKDRADDFHEKATKMRKELGQLYSKMQNLQDSTMRKATIIRNLEGNVMNLSNKNETIRNKALTEIGSVRRAQDALASAEMKLQAKNDERDMNDEVLLVDGRIATNGLLVPIRGAMRRAAIAVYGEKNIPSDAGKIELRGYNLSNGERAVGVVVPKYAEREVAKTLNARLDEKLNSGAEIKKALENGAKIPLEGGFELRYAPMKKRMVVWGMKPRSNNEHRRIFESMKGEDGLTFDATSGSVIINSEKGIADFTKRFPVKTDEDSEGNLALAAMPKRVDRSNMKHERAPVTPENVVKPIPPVGEGGTSNRLTPKASKAVADMLANALDTVIRPGRLMRNKSDAEFRTRAGVGFVKPKYVNDWRRVGHELGHRFEQLGFKGDSVELKAVAEEIYPTDIKDDKLKAKEGLAEFFQLYVVDPIRAEQLAPKTYEAFKNFISADPDLKVAFDTAETIVNNDLHGTPLERGLRSVVMPREKAANKIVGDEYKILSGKAGFLKWFLYKTTDSTIPLKALMNEARKAGNDEMIDVAKLASVTGGAREIARHAFETRPTDHLGRYISARSLHSIADEAIGIANKEMSEKFYQTKEDGSQGKKMTGFHIFSAAMTARLSELRYEKGGFKITPIAYPEAKAVLEQVKDMYGQKYIDLIDEYGKTLSKIVMDKTERAGIITSEIRDIIESKYDGWYLPTYTASKNVNSVPGGDTRTNRNPVKRYKESTEPIYNFLDATMKKLMEVEQSVQDKRIISGLREAMQSGRVGSFIVEEKRPMIATKLDKFEIADAVNRWMEDPIDVSEIGESLMTFFRPGGIKELMNDEPVIVDIHDGQATYMRLAKDLWDSVQSLKPAQANTGIRWLAKASSIGRMPKVLNPKFLWNQLARDTLSAGIQKNGKNSLTLATIRGMWLSAGGDQKLYDQYVQSGAFLSSAENVLKMLRRTSISDGLLPTDAPGLKRNAAGVFHWVLDRPGSVLHWQEQIQRLSEFDTVRARLAKERQAELTSHYEDVLSSDVSTDGEKKTAQENLDTLNSIDFAEILRDGDLEIPDFMQKDVERIYVEAGHAASEVTANFNLHGQSRTMREIAPAVSFLHGGLQGLYREGRAYAGEGTAKGAGRTLARIMGYIMPLTIIAFMLNKDKSQDLLSETRDKYWLIPMGHVQLAIPKPFSFAIPANHMERMMDWMFSKDPQARKPFEDWTNIYKNALSMPFQPELIRLLVGVYANKDDFGNPITPQSQQNLQKELQYGPKTSEMAKFLTREFGGLNPREYDYIMQAYSGSSKPYLQALDLATGKKPVAPENIPVLSDTLLGPTKGGSRMIDQFYKDKGESTSLNDSAKKWIDQYKNTGQLPAQKLTDQQVKLVLANPMFNAAGKVITDMRKSADAVQQNPNMTADQKSQSQDLMNFYEKVAAGFLYGYTPEPPVGVSQQQVDQFKNMIQQQVSKDVVNEKNNPGGATSHAGMLKFLSDMMNR